MKGVWLLITIGLVACSPRHEPHDASGADEAEVMAASRAFSAAYVRGDTTAIRSLYTEDAVLLPPGREVRGRANIVRFFAPRPSRINVSHAMSSSELEIVGDLAVDIGTWSNTWKTDDAEEQTAAERYLVVWRRGADGQWRIQYDMWHRSPR